MKTKVSFSGSLKVTTPKGTVEIPFEHKSASDTKIHKRAPRGSRIEQWADGTYHVYQKLSGGYWNCLDEVLTKKEALDLAWNTKARGE